MTRVATQVASPEVIAPDVVQGCRWFQVLEQKHTIRLMPAPLTCAGHHYPYFFFTYIGVQQCFAYTYV